MTSHEDAQQARKVKSGDRYVQAKIDHWSKFGTPSDMNPATGAAAPKWRLEEAEKARATRERAR